MLTPTQIAEYTEIIGERYDDLQDLLMADIMKKVKQGLKDGYSVQWDVKKILETGGAWDDEIIAKIQKTTGLAQKDVERLLKKAGIESIRNENKMLPKEHQLPLHLSRMQMRTIMAGIRNVNGLIGNMANVTKDSTLDMYSKLLNEGYTMMATGSFSLDQAVEKVGTELVKKGVTGIEYPSGRKDRIEVAVRRAMRTSTNQTMLRLGEQNANELDTDLVEVTAHVGARPSHALWQGKVYSLHGKTKGYRTLAEATGYGTMLGLGGVNCSHSFFSYFKHDSKREYTPHELKDINEAKVTVNGEEMTVYNASQKLRGMERKMREYKRLQEFAQKDTTDKQMALRAKIHSFERQTGLRSNRGRWQVFTE